MNINILGNRKPVGPLRQIEIDVGEANRAFVLDAELIGILCAALRQTNEMSARKCASSMEDMKKEQPANFAPFLDTVINSLKH